MSSRLHRIPLRGALSGQALTEVLVALLFLVPLWIAAFHLWLWQDLQHAAIGAARYALFDTASRPGGAGVAAVQARTLIRVLSAGAGRVRVLDPVDPGSPARYPPRADWRGLDALAPVLTTVESLQVTVDSAPQPESAERVERTAFAMLSPALALGVGTFDLGRAAARRSRVQISLDSRILRGAGFHEPRLRLQESLYAMVDPWVSRGAEQVAARTRSLSAVGLVGSATEQLEPVKDAIELFEPAVRGLCPGRLDPDIVPEDRLQGGSPALNDLRRRPC